MATGLIRRNGRYSIRRIIPTDLQGRYGRREIVRALGTANPAEARRLHARAWVQIDDEFADRRSPLASDITLPTPPIQLDRRPRVPADRPSTGNAVHLLELVERWTSERKPLDRTARRTLSGASKL